MSDWSRVYEEAGPDGYPVEWHESIKDAVRGAAGHRCVRCRHPYEKGAGEWSPCDEWCTHGGPYRLHDPVAGWRVEDGKDASWVAGVVVQARWRILTVHHLNRNKLDCRWWNLVSLCQRCHLVIQGKVYLERRWLKPHSEWFKPYAAAWYAFDRLGENLSRGETMARLDELLALEDRQLEIAP